MGNLKLKSCMFLLVALIVFASCKNNKIDDLEAKKLINDVLKLPRVASMYILCADLGNHLSNEKIGGAFNIDYNNKITFKGYFLDYQYLFDNNILFLKKTTVIGPSKYAIIDISKEYEKYLILYESYEYYRSPYMNCEPYNGLFKKVKVYDLKIGDITGIAYNEDKTIASIRFTIKSTNHTPFAKATKDLNYNSAVNSEIKFRKFDTGWQLDDEKLDNKEQNDKTYLKNYLFDLCIKGNVNTTSYSHCYFDIE